MSRTTTSTRFYLQNPACEGSGEQPKAGETKPGITFQGAPVTFPKGLCVECGTQQSISTTGKIRKHIDRRTP